MGTGAAQEFKAEATATVVGASTTPPAGARAGFFATGALLLAQTVRLRRTVERGEPLPITKAQQKRREQTFKRYLDN
ncbi:hypothetical protein [Streptomyces sp. NPDC048106]|uniref:hypothetical protein n=1 Tax=Streptomyces sp. NPDC048106 TaxID=3155750 RepID=UPI003452701C